MNAKTATATDAAKSVITFHLIERNRRKRRASAQTITTKVLNTIVILKIVVIAVVIVDNSTKDCNSIVTATVAKAHAQQRNRRR